MPALSTRAPAERRPAARTAAIQGLDSRVSRPRRTAGSAHVLRREWARARPVAKMVMGSSGDSPAMARMPSVPKRLRTRGAVIDSILGLFVAGRSIGRSGFDAADEGAVG